MSHFSEDPLLPRAYFKGHVIPQHIVGPEGGRSPGFSDPVARIEFWADSRHAGIYVNNLGSVDNVNELVRLGEDDTVQSIVLKWPGYKDYIFYFDGGVYELSNLARMLADQLQNARLAMAGLPCQTKCMRIDPSEKLWLLELRREQCLRWQPVLYRERKF